MEAQPQGQHRHSHPLARNRGGTQYENTQEERKSGQDGKFVCRGRLRRCGMASFVNGFLLNSELISFVELFAGLSCEVIAIVLVPVMFSLL